MRYTRLSLAIVFLWVEDGSLHSNVEVDSAKLKFRQPLWWPDSCFLWGWGHLTYDALTSGLTVALCSDTVPRESKAVQSWGKLSSFQPCEQDELRSLWGGGSARAPHLRSRAGTVVGQRPSWGGLLHYHIIQISDLLIEDLMDGHMTRAIHRLNNHWLPLQSHSTQPIEALVMTQIQPHLVRNTRE